MADGFRVVSRGSIALIVLVASVIVVMNARRPSGPAIFVNGPTLTIENQTNQEWRGVTVTVNAYYRAQSPSLAARGRLDVSLRTLMTGLGQYFNPAREPVRTVEVRATDVQGKPVSIDWAGK